jgi:hypothetical protein
MGKDMGLPDLEQSPCTAVPPLPWWQKLELKKKVAWNISQQSNPKENLKMG